MATTNGETFMVGEYVAKATGKPLLALKLVSPTGRATNSVIMANDIPHMLDILENMMDHMEAYEYTGKFLADREAYNAAQKASAKVSPAAKPTAAPDMAAMMAEIEKLKAANAALAAKPVENGRPAAAPSKTTAALASVRARRAAAAAK